MTRAALEKLLARRDRVAAECKRLDAELQAAVSVYARDNRVWGLTVDGLRRELAREAA